MAMVKDPGLLSDDELLANLAAMIVLDASDGSLKVKEEAIDAELMELDRQVIDSELGPTVTGVKTDSEVGPTVTGVKHTAVARNACMLANDVVSKLPTPGRKRTKLGFDKNSAWNYYEEYRHSRRGKPDHAVGPRWHYHPKVTWTEQITPTSKSLPQWAGGKPVQPCYPPPADLFIAGLAKIVENSKHFDERQAEDWLPRVRGCPRCGEGDRYANYCICK